MKKETEFQRGTKLQRQGKFDEAITAYRRSIEINPNFSWTYYKLGETFTELGRLEEAVSSYQQATALNSDSDCFRSKLEQVLNQLGCQDVKGLVNSNEKISNLDDTQVPIGGEFKTKEQVNHVFLSNSREFWNVNSMYEAMFDRVITDPEINRLPLEKKIELWEKSAIVSVQQILQDIPVKQEWKVLDIGCGVGRCIKPMRDMFLEVDGVDISHKMIEFAKQYLSEGKQNGKLYVNSGSDLLQLQSRNYDFVYSMIVFQHIRSISVIKSYFQEIHRVLKPGGYFKLQVHDTSNSNMGTFEEEAQEDKQYTFSGNSYTPDELQHLLKTSDFDVVTIKHQTPWIWATVKKPADSVSHVEVGTMIDFGIV